MKRTLVLCLIMFVLGMPSVVKAERNSDLLQNLSQQDQYKRDQQERDQQEKDKQLRDKQKRDKQLRDQQGKDKQFRDKQQRNQQERDKQLRVKQQQDQPRNDKQLRDKQQRDQQERDKQLRFKQQQDQTRKDKQLRDKQQRDQQERDKQLRFKQQQDQLGKDKQLRSKHQRDSRKHWTHPSYQHKNWQRTDHRTYGAMPFNWYQKFDRHSSDYHMEPIHAREWNNRFPGLHPYRWLDRRGEGFWYREQRIVDAIMFYNDSEELVSIGFVHDGIFIMLREDDQYYENHDSFFLSWWNHNGGITIRL